MCAGLFSTTGPVIAILAGDLFPEAAPDVLLGAATLVVTANLKQANNLQTNGSGKIAERVESTILPLFDFRHMTQLVVARNGRLASREQQNALIAEFRTLLVRTYSTALANYRDQAIEYQPLLDSAWRNRGHGQVHREAARSRTDDHGLRHDMEKTTAGCKVYDIKIAGISLITTYQSTFAQTLRDGGVDGLIKSLSAKNTQADSGLRSRENGARPILFMYAVIPSVFRGGR